MSNETKFIDGLMFKPPHENAPEYVIAKGSIRREELIGWLQQQSGDWVNFDLKESQQGKYYASVDDWKPQRQGGGSGGSGGSRGGAPQRPARQSATDAQKDDFADDDIPFLRNDARL